MSRKRNTNLKRNTMTYDEVYTKKKQVKAVLNRPRNTWQNALDAIGIPSELVTAAVQKERLVAIYEYLHLCIPSGLQTPSAHDKAERIAFLRVTAYLDRYKNGVN